jgi:hypothetical protein
MCPRASDLALILDHAPCRAMPSALAQVGPPRRSKRRGNWRADLRLSRASSPQASANSVHPQCPLCFSLTSHPPCFQTLAHSFAHAQKRAPVFSCTYELFVRSAKSHLPYFQSLLHSLAKTPGVGGTGSRIIQVLLSTFDYRLRILLYRRHLAGLGQRWAVRS